MLNRYLSTITIILIAACSTLQAAEPYVTGEYELVPGGYVVQFEVHNPLPEIVYMWSVYTPDASAVMAPDGWRIYQTFREVNWSAQQDLAYAIQPGQSLGGFSFTAQNPPGTSRWVISSSTGYVGDVTPVLIPEPCSLIVLGLAVSGLGAVRIRRRRR